MNKRKIIIVLLSLALLALALYLILRKPQVKTVEERPIIKFPLKLGSSGYGVEQVQKYLNKKYDAGLKVDGDWGNNTNQAALTFLKRDNISEDVFYKWNLDNV